MNSYKPGPEKVETRANHAVWLTSKCGSFEIKPAPYTAPSAREIVVENRALAINPIDWITQSIGDLIFTWAKYPFIFGSDLAGEVVEVGSGVSRFKVGDRVLGHAVGSDKTRNRSAEGAFQQYTVLQENMAAPIPGEMSFAEAAVLPLGLSTAACGLYEKDQLALQYPSSTPKSIGKSLLIWGGSTSVGSNAIQLAVASGYEVVTTSSPRNFDYVKKLGATQVFDYNSRTIVRDLKSALKDKTIAGALAIGVGSTEACVDILSACNGTKFVSVASPPVSFQDAPHPRTIYWLVPVMVRMISANISLMFKATSVGIKSKFIFGSSLLNNEVSKRIYEDFLPAALAERRYIAAPDALVIGHGLESILKAMDAQKRGVSAKKLVVTL